MFPIAYIYLLHEQHFQMLIVLIFCINNWWWERNWYGHLFANFAFFIFNFYLLKFLFQYCKSNTKRD